MAKFEEASKRMFGRVFVCRKCKKKKKLEPVKVTAKSVICKNCGSRAFRPIKKQK
ncbi:MAG: hypothetical protein V1914_01480 [archaeon]